MQVVELEARHVRVALRRKVTHASHVRTETENVVVRCKLSDGSTGYGEGVPRDYVTGETIDFSLDLLKRSDLAKQLDTDLALAVKTGNAEGVQKALAVIKDEKAPTLKRAALVLSTFAGMLSALVWLLVQNWG